MQRSFAEKERDLQEQQLLMATKLGEAEHTAATLRAALVQFAETLTSPRISKKMKRNGVYVCVEK